MMIYMTTNAISAPTAFLIRSVGGQYFAGVSQGWVTDARWAFECETRRDAQNLIDLLDRKCRVVTRTEVAFIERGRQAASR